MEELIKQILILLPMIVFIIAILIMVFLDKILDFIKNIKRKISGRLYVRRLTKVAAKQMLESFEIKKEKV